MTGKLCLIEAARAAGVPVISCLGTGNKTDPTKLTVADIYETSVCPLARIMRKECKKRGVASLKVVYSTEEPIIPPRAPHPADAPRTRDVPGSTAFVPAAAGLLLAREAVMALIRT